MAYEIIKRLETNKELALLQILSNNIEVSRRNNKKLHEVWELSFDWKDCRSNKFIYQKLDYMHNNPCVGKRLLCANPLEYLHSSARFYITGEPGIYPVTNFMEMEDVSFNDGKQQA